MKKHKLIEKIEFETEDNIPIYIADDDILMDKIFISKGYDQNGNRITIISAYEYMPNEIHQI